MSNTCMMEGKKIVTEAFGRNSVLILCLQIISFTEFMLHHPDLQLDEAVSIEAVVLSHAAVADFVATEIQL